MKKLHLSLISMAVAMLFASSAFGYQYNMNVTGERTQSAYGIVGDISNAYYNPVGLTKIADGIHFDLGNRILWLDKESSGTAFGGDNPVSSTWNILLPNMAVAYKNGKGAVFFAVDIRDGGAGGEWGLGEGSIAIASSPDALGTTIGADCTKIEGSTFTIAYTTGASFALTDMVAVSGSFRAFSKMANFMFKINDFDTGSGLLEKVENNDLMYGFAPVLNVMVSPLAGLDINLSWQGSATLKGVNTQTQTLNVATVKTKTATSEYIGDVLALGVQYTVFKGLNVTFSYVLDFGGEIKIDDVVLENANVKQTHKIGAGAQYQIMPLLAVSGGLMFQTTDTEDNANTNASNAAFNQLNIGAGVVITPIANLNIELAVSNQLYFESEYDGTGAVPGQMTHKQNGLLISLGANYKL